MIGFLKTGAACAFALLCSGPLSAAQAVAIAGVMQMNPWTDDGRPVDGARIRLPINFTQAEEPAPKAKP